MIKGATLSIDMERRQVTDKGLLFAFALRQQQILLDQHLNGCCHTVISEFKLPKSKFKGLTVCNADINLLNTFDN